MKTTKLVVTAMLLTAIVGCKEADKKSEKQETTQEMHHGGEHHKKDDTKTANEYMHKSSVDELIERFESPERDAYQKPAVVLDYLGDLEGKKIMDIGAGSGYFSVKLAEKDAQVIAADVSDDFQKALKKRIEANNLENIELRKIPYDSPNLSAGEVDMVLIVNTYHHIENRSAYFAKVKEGIKSDGELVIIDFFKKELPVGPPVNHKVALETVKAELKEAGYTNLEVNTDLLPYQFIIKAK